ncbi:MAG: hypothetical protein RSA66_10150 [Muribaculaceae bacterium]
MKILIVSKENKALCAMAHEFMQAHDDNMIVCSAVIADDNDYGVHNVTEYQNEPWDYVITIGDADEVCDKTYFHGVVRNVLRLGVDNETCESFTGDKCQLIRDDIYSKVRNLYSDNIRGGGKMCSCGANDICRCD